MCQKSSWPQALLIDNFKFIIPSLDFDMQCSPKLVVTVKRHIIIINRVYKQLIAFLT